MFGKGIAEKYKQTILQGVALSVILIGWKSALAADQLLIVIISMVVGATIGEGLNIEGRLEKLGQWLEARVSAGAGGSLARGFVTASLVFCVGSMAIVGSLESGLTGNHQTLFAKSILDGVISIVFASTMGAGVLFSSAAVFLYQGLITLAASHGLALFGIPVSAAPLFGGAIGLIGAEGIREGLKRFYNRKADTR